MTALLTMSGISKSFGATQALRDVSLDVSSGEVIGLLGPNGAGKTTCFYMIVGLIPADAGTIELDERDLTHLDGREEGHLVEGRGDHGSPAVPVRHDRRREVHPVHHGPAEQGAVHVGVLRQHQLGHLGGRVADATALGDVLRTHVGWLSGCEDAPREEGRRRFRVILWGAVGGRNRRQECTFATIPEMAVAPSGRPCSGRRTLRDGGRAGRRPSPRNDEGRSPVWATGLV